MFRNLAYLFLAGLCIAAESAFATSLKPSLPLLPENYTYMECTAVNCTYQTLKDNAVIDALRRTPHYVMIKDYDYLLANLETETLTLLHVRVIDTCGGEPGCYHPKQAFTSTDPVPSEYALQFAEYAQFVKDVIKIFDIPSNITPTFTQEEGLVGLMQNHLSQNYPALNNPFISVILITLNFSDGSKAVFRWQRNSTYRLQYVCCAVDADGNPIAPDAETLNEYTLNLEDAQGAGSYANYSLGLITALTSDVPVVDGSRISAGSGGSTVECYIGPSGTRCIVRQN